MTVAVLLPTLAADAGARALEDWAATLNAVALDARHVHEGYDAYLSARPAWHADWGPADDARGEAALIAYVAAQRLSPVDLAASSILMRSRRLNVATAAFGPDYDPDAPFLDLAYLDRLALEPISAQDFGLIDTHDDRQPNLALFEA